MTRVGYSIIDRLAEECAKDFRRCADELGTEDMWDFMAGYWAHALRTEESIVGCGTSQRTSLANRFEKAVYRQLTNGAAVIPEGIKNLTPRDVPAAVSPSERRTPEEA